MVANPEEMKKAAEKSVNQEHDLGAEKQENSGTFSVSDAPVAKNAKVQEESPNNMPSVQSGAAAAAASPVQSSNPRADAARLRIEAARSQFPGLPTEVAKSFVRLEVLIEQGEKQKCDTEKRKEESEESESDKEADMDGGLRMVPPLNLNKWQEAIRVTRHMVKALNEPGRVTLEVYVDALESLSVRYTYAVPTLEDLAATVVAKRLPNKGAVEKLEVPETLKFAIRNEADFLADSGSNAFRTHMTAVLDK